MNKAPGFGLFNNLHNLRRLELFPRPIWHRILQKTDQSRKSQTVVRERRPFELHDGTENEIASKGRRHEA